MMSDGVEPVHPGKILSEEMKSIGINASDLARRIIVPDNRIYQLVHGKRSLTADTALRLSKFFCTTPEYWVNLQVAYDLETARQAADEVLREIKPFKRKVVQSEMAFQGSMS